MRILLISEGSHEGHAAPEKPQALRTIVQRVLAADHEYSFLDVHDLPHIRVAPGEGGHFKLAMRALQHATKQGYEAVVLVTDADNNHERIRQFDQAQDDLRIPIPRAFGIAVEAFDAWILADHMALSQACGASVALQPMPENLTGSKGSPDHPKALCQTLMNQHGWAGTQSKLYESVCANANLDLIAKRCPKGFEPFLKRLKALQSAIY